MEISTSTALAAPLLNRLEEVRRTGPARWHARCPEHDDRSPSLSVRDIGDRVLIHCFAGCEPDDVLRAVGIGWSDLYPDPWQCARKRPNEAALRHVRKVLRDLDPLDIERSILRIAAADIRADKPLSIEDRGRIEVARQQIIAAGGTGG